MSISDYIFPAIGAIIALGGLASIFTGKVYMMGKSADKYTEESLMKYARPYGVMNLLSGVGLVSLELLNSDLFMIGSFRVSTGLAVLVVMVILSAIVGVTTRKILVKK